MLARRMHIGSFLICIQVSIQRSSDTLELGTEVHKQVMAHEQQSYPTVSHQRRGLTVGGIDYKLTILLHRGYHCEDSGGC